MPRLQQPLSVFLDHGDDATDLVRAEPSTLGDLDRLEPDLDRRLAAINVNVRRLVGLGL